MNKNIKHCNKRTTMVFLFSSEWTLFHFWHVPLFVQLDDKNKNTVEHKRQCDTHGSLIYTCHGQLLYKTTRQLTEIFTSSSCCGKYATNRMVHGLLSALFHYSIYRCFILVPYDITLMLCMFYLITF